MSKPILTDIDKLAHLIHELASWIEVSFPIHEGHDKAIEITTKARAIREGHDKCVSLLHRVRNSAREIHTRATEIQAATIGTSHKAALEINERAAGIVTDVDEAIGSADD